MSGLESVASVIAVLTVSYQIISSLHTAIKELKSLPKEFELLQREIAIIRECISNLSRLITADDETFEVFQRFQFAEAISICAETCREFHQSLAKWISNPAQSRRVRARLWLHRKDIQSVRAEVSSAKETTVFTAVSVQLYMRVKNSTSTKEKEEAYKRAEADLRDMSSQTPVLSGSCDLQGQKPGSRVEDPSMLLSEETNNGQIELYNPTVNDPEGPRSQHQDYNRGRDSHQRQQENASSARDRARHAEQQSRETFDQIGDSINHGVKGNVNIKSSAKVNAITTAAAQQKKQVSQTVDKDVNIEENAGDSVVNGIT